MSNDLELLTRSYADQIQEWDTAARELLDKITLVDAAGVQLDGLGQIIGVERQGLDDDDYRSLLRAYIAVNSANGTIERVNSIVRLAVNEPASAQTFSLVEGAPAEFKVEYTETLDAGVGLIAADAMYAGRAAGVHAVFEYHDTTPIFTFDGVGSSAFDGGFFLKHAIRNRTRRESDIL